MANTDLAFTRADKELPEGWRRFGIAQVAADELRWRLARLRKADPQPGRSGIVFDLVGVENRRIKRVLC